MTTVTLPEVSLETVKTPEDLVVEFFYLLGWDGNANLDGTKIKLNENDWKRYCGRANELAVSMGKEAFSGGFVWMNWGPSTDGNVPEGKVLLEDDWIREEN